MKRLIDRAEVLNLLKQRRDFLYKVYKQNKNSIAAAQHLEALETTEEIYDMISEMPYVSVEEQEAVSLSTIPFSIAVAVDINRITKPE